jgi:hypothetical protein
MVADPCLFDLEKDPDELRNVFSVPVYRDTVRELARQLDQYCRATNEPHYSDANVRADLKWAIEGQGEYRPPVRRALKKDTDRPVPEKSFPHDS